MSEWMDSDDDTIGVDQIVHVGDRLIDGQLAWINDDSDEPARVTDLGNRWALMPSESIEKNDYLMTGETSAVMQYWIRNCPATAHLFGVIDNGEDEPGLILPKIDYLNEFLDSRLRSIGGVSLRPQLVDFGDIPIVHYLRSIQNGIFPVSGRSSFYPHDIVDHAIGAATIPKSSVEAFQELCQRAEESTLDDAVDGLSYQSVLGDGFDLATANVVPTGVSEFGTTDILTEVLRSALRVYSKNVAGDKRIIEGRQLDTQGELFDAITRSLSMKGHVVQHDNLPYIIGVVEKTAEHYQTVYELLA